MDKKEVAVVAVAILLHYAVVVFILVAPAWGEDCFSKATADQLPYRSIKVVDAGRLARQCKDMSCFEDATPQRGTFEITYYNLPEGDDRFGILHGCLGFENKCVAVGPDSDLYRFAAELFASGVYPDALGDVDAANFDIDSQWYLINEVRCEYRKWCRQNIDDAKKRRVCRRDFRRRKRHQRVYKGGVFKNLSDYVFEGSGWS